MDDYKESKDIHTRAFNALERYFFPQLSGSSKRKLERQNTIHLRGICPNCGKTNMRFYKRIYTKSGSNMANRWFCKGCGKAFKREDLEYVKFV